VNPIGYSSLECSAPDGLVVLRLATTRMKIDIGRFPVQRKRNATLVLPSMRIASSYFEVKLWRCQRVEHVKSRKVRKLNSNAQKKSNAFSLLAAARKRERERERERRGSQTTYQTPPTPCERFVQQTRPVPSSLARIHSMSISISIRFVPYSITLSSW
jgi:hypothetical protein